MKGRIFISVFLLIGAMLACSLKPSISQSGGTPGVDSIATLVSEQLTAAVQSPTPALLNQGTAIATQRSALSALLVAYVKDGNICLWDGIVPKQLTNSGQDSSPKFSDDGALIAFRRNGELWAINSDGNNERVIAPASALAALPHTNPGSLEPRLFDFAPHSHDVYFNTTVAGDPFPLPEYNLVKVNADSPSPKLLLNSDQGGAEFVFSPDGTKIALPRSDKINVVNADGSNLKTVFTFPLVLLYSEQNYIPQIAWMPDGSGFKTVIPAKDAMNHPLNPSRFYYISAGGGQPAQLAEFVAAFGHRSYISPDGAKVLYVKPQGANLELHVIDASTADQMYFSYKADLFGILGWATDSTHVVYWMDDKRRVWLGSPGSPAFPLSDITFAEEVTWVDQNRYLFLSETELRIRTLDQPSILIDAGVKDGFGFSVTK